MPGGEANSERAGARRRDRTRGGSGDGAQKRGSSRASAPRRLEGLRAVEARIEAMELQLRQLAAKVEEIAQRGNYLETRRVSEEYALLERDLRTLYDAWAKESEA